MIGQENESLPMRTGWILVVVIGVVFLVAAHPLAVRTVNAYPGWSAEKKIRKIAAQTVANRIGGLVAIALGIYGWFNPNFLSLVCHGDPGEKNTGN